MTNKINGNFTDHSYLSRQTKSEGISGSFILSSLFAAAGAMCWGHLNKDWRLVYGGMAVGALAIRALVMTPAVDPYAAALNDPKNEFVKRIQPHEKAEILQKFKTLKPITGQELAAFKKGDWTAPIYAQPDWPYVAFRAYLDGHLDAMQISKLFLFAELQKGGKISHETDPDGIESYRITNEQGKCSGQIYQIVDGKGLVANTMRDLLMYSMRLNLLEIHQLENVLKTLPAEETQFMVVDAAPLLSADEYQAALKRGSTDIYNALLQDFSTPFLMLPDKRRGIIQQVIIPPRVYQEILKVKFGGNWMAPRLVLGYSPKEKLTDPNSRVAGVPCPFVRLPQRIHTIIDSSNPLAFYHHDLAHLFIESANPHRPTWINLALSFQGKDRSLFLELLDRNFPLYGSPELQRQYIRRNLDSTEAFWYSLPFMERNIFDIWSGSAGANRMEAILRHLAGIMSLESLLLCDEKESYACRYSLKPWADAAQRILSEQNLVLDESKLGDSEIDDPRIKSARTRF